MKPPFPPASNFVPPQPGASIPYVCQNCGEHFSKKKGIFSETVKCPKCGSSDCVSPVCW